jgi:hypothetical protein
MCLGLLIWVNGWLCQRVLESRWRALTAPFASRTAAYGRKIQGPLMAQGVCKLLAAMAVIGKGGLAWAGPTRQGAV